MASTFQDMPPPMASASAAAAHNMMMALRKSGQGDPAALMYYYQMAEKCWGLNSPPGSDSSSTSSSLAPRTSSAADQGSITTNCNSSSTPISPSNFFRHLNAAASIEFSSPSIPLQNHAQSTSVVNNSPLAGLTGMPPSASMMMSGLFTPAVAAAAAARQFAQQQQQQQQQQQNCTPPSQTSPTRTVPTSNRLTGALTGATSAPTRSSPTKITTRVGVGQGQVTCNCGTVFPNLEILEHHAKSVHPENTNLPCTVCSKQFPNLPKLQRHMANHADGPDLRKFKCTRCGKAFKFKHHLKEHERIHTGEKPFECKHCGKRFSHSGSYSSHTTSKKCMQLGRRPNMGSATTAAAAAANTMRPNNSDHHALNLAGTAGIPWQAMRPQMNSKGVMPLSPPLTPLPASIGRFPHAPMLGAMGSYHPLLLAAQYQQNPFLPRPQLPAPGQSPIEIMEQLQRLMQLRTSGEMAAHGVLPGVLRRSEETSAASLDEKIQQHQQTQPPTSPLYNNNNNYHMKSEADLKKEEEMVEDEMKEDEEEEEELDDSEEPQQPQTASSTEEDNSKKEAVKDEDIFPGIPESLKQQFQFTLLRKMWEDLKKPKQETPNLDPVGVGSPLETTPCKFHCGKSFATTFDLYQHHELCQANMDSLNDINGTQYEESMVSDTNDNDMSSANGILNNSNSSGDERKVRVRTLISDEQLAILKAYYNMNPRPKREELERISAKIGHPFKVVKVWFQNSRARDRREGKPVVHQASSQNMPFFMNGQSPQGNSQSPAFFNMAASGLFPRLPLLSGPLMGQMGKASLSPRSEAKSPYSTTSDEAAPPSRRPHQQADQPLDLSNKGSSPSVSPLSENKDEDPSEALNLSNGNLSNDLLEHFRRAAAAAMSSAATVSCGAASVTASFAPSSVASNLAPLRLSRPSDIYRFQEDLETSGSAGSGGATTDEEGHFACGKCDKIFTKRSSLSRHKYEHSDQRPYQCDVCVKAFKHKHHLVEHKRLHTGERPFKCDKCLKRFSHSGSYSQHINHRYSSCKPPIDAAIVMEAGLGPLGGEDKDTVAATVSSSEDAVIASSKIAEIMEVNSASQQPPAVSVSEEATKETPMECESVASSSKSPSPPALEPALAVAH